MVTTSFKAGVPLRKLHFLTGEAMAFLSYSAGYKRGTGPIPPLPGRTSDFFFLIKERC